MNSHQITVILNSNPATRQIFKGCYPCNFIPNIKSSKSVYIVNLDPEGMKGSHWITIFTNSNKLYYFDSLTLPTSDCIISSIPLRFSKIIRNLKPYQSPLSKTCGHHCISLTYFLSQELTFEKYLKMLDSIQNPDLFVTKVVNKLIK